MKIFTVILLGCIFTTIVEGSDDGESTTEIKKPVLEEDATRDKRTLGINKDIHKELELKTKHGSVLKIFKSIKYNDGGGLTHLPSLLHSIAIKKKLLLDHIRNKMYLKHKLKMLKKNQQTNDTIVAVRYNDSKPIEQKPAKINRDQTKAQLLDKLSKHKKLLKLKKKLLIKKISDVASVLTDHKKIGVSCGPTGL